MQLVRELLRRHGGRGVAEVLVLVHSVVIVVNVVVVVVVDSVRSSRS